MPDPILLEHAQRLGLALAIGFLVGVERGWKQRAEDDGQRVAGIRTFALAGLLGGLCGLLAAPATGVAVVLAAAFAGVFVLFHYRGAAKNDNSATSAVAGLVVFGLGAYAVLGDALLAAAAGVAVTLLLAFKQPLHGWLTRLSWVEIRSALTILAATFIVLPFLPGGFIDPWGLLDVRALWLLTIVIACASFGGYVALRVLGHGVGLAVSALIGGLVSSTAVTLDLARRARAGEVDNTHAAASAALATATSVARVGVITAAVSPDLFLRLLPALAAAGAVLVLSLIAAIRQRSGETADDRFRALRSPLDIVSVLRFAGVLAVLLVAANLAVRTFGQAGLTVFAATAGLADVDAVVLSVANLLPQQLGLEPAANAILIALASNQVFKLAAAAILGSRGFVVRLTLIMGLAALATGAAQIIVG